MAEAVGTNHNAKRDFCGALEEMLSVAGDGDAGGNKNKSENRDHDGEEAVPLDADEVVLEGHDDEETTKEGAVIAGAGGDKRHVLAQGEERNDGEENQRADASEEDS